jgi:hypothetical protein
MAEEMDAMAARAKLLDAVATDSEEEQEKLLGEAGGLLKYASMDTSDGTPVVKSPSDAVPDKVYFDDLTPLKQQMMEGIVADTEKSLANALGKKYYSDGEYYNQDEVNRKTKRLNRFKRMLAGEQSISQGMFSNINREVKKSVKDDFISLFQDPSYESIYDNPYFEATGLLSATQFNNSRDPRDWEKIMLSADPIAAARLATRQAIEAGAFTKNPKPNYLPSSGYIDPANILGQVGPIALVRDRKAELLGYDRPGMERFKIFDPSGAGRNFTDLGYTPEVAMQRLQRLGYGLNQDQIDQLRELAYANYGPDSANPLDSGSGLFQVVDNITPFGQYEPEMLAQDFLTYGMDPDLYYGVDWQTKKEYNAAEKLKAEERMLKEQAASMTDTPAPFQSAGLASMTQYSPVYTQTSPVTLQPLMPQQTGLASLPTQYGGIQVEANPLLSSLPSVRSMREGGIVQSFSGGGDAMSLRDELLKKVEKNSNAELAGDYTRQIKQLFQDFADKKPSRFEDLGYTPFGKPGDYDKAALAFKAEHARLKKLQQEAANRGIVTGKDIFYPEKFLNKPETRQFAEAAGVSYSEAANAMRSGMNTDARDWAAIMASDNPYQAAMDAKQAQIEAFDPRHFKGIVLEQAATNPFGDAAAGSNYLLDLDEKTYNYLMDMRTSTPRELRSAERIMGYNPETGNLGVSVYYKNPNTTTPYIDKQRFIYENQPYKFPSGEFDPSALENLPNYPSEYKSVTGALPTVQDFADYGYTDPQASFEGIMTQYGYYGDDATDPVNQSVDLAPMQQYSPVYTQVSPVTLQPLLPTQYGGIQSLQMQTKAV